MTEDEITIVRADRVEMLWDRRLWYLRLIANPGTLMLLEQDGAYVMGFEADTGKSWFAPLHEVTCLGQPEGGVAALRSRALRLQAEERRMIITFSGTTAETEGGLVDLQLSRLTGDFDPILGTLSAVKTLKGSLAAWGASKDAVDWWTTLFDALAQDAAALDENSGVQSTEDGSGVDDIESGLAELQQQFDDEWNETSPHAGSVDDPVPLEEDVVLTDEHGRRVWRVMLHTSLLDPEDAPPAPAGKVCVSVCLSAFRATDLHEPGRLDDLVVRFRGPTGTWRRTTVWPELCEAVELDPHAELDSWEGGGSAFIAKVPRNEGPLGRWTVTFRGRVVHFSVQ